MVSPSQFYKSIGQKGYELIVANKIISNKHIVHDMSFPPEYNIHTDTQYGKYVEQLLIDYLRTDNSKKIKNELPNINLLGFKKLCKGSIPITTSSNDIKYDLLYGKCLIDVKAYKNEFSEKEIHSFNLQLSLYYSMLDKRTKSLIKKLVIYNPIRNVLIMFDSKNVNTKKLLDVYNYINESIFIYFDKSNPILSFFGFTKSAREIKLKKKVDKLKEELIKYKETINSIKKLI